ncbi:hypothetical protein FPSE_02254 [Fusarium pseudograminearum CS3096]|uniref:Reticulon domain-containing protein n=1 Tax=Fusarium pseudograminearum (strain CS3096) TaxID=1028729 RepID=K3UYA1_FUSPC|nr:hypothetical protein FPSE_02254 [Fusarium pseudograminearum CS3096]EKJ77756.1 hypothetical protein FPSE_02254 [Fusarium pseudograminearum CS3096]KAF0641322.1 hypothetical protein FPSE5266_02254 [Fusarium pseudograminearum]
MSGIQNNFQPVMAEDTTGPQINGQRRRSGPLKDIVAQQDSLYKYISWEDPARTIGSYFAALGFLLAVHHLRLTQLALKTSAIGLGVMSVAEFAGRSFGPNNFVSRMRPKQYKTFPESTLNATLKDIHDFIQYAAVKAQKVIFAEDLEKTFSAFLIATSLYFLTQFMTPFGITILALTTVYIIPLVRSPQGRGIARDGIARAQEIGNVAVDQASTMAQDSKAAVSNMASRAQDTASNLTSSAQDTAGTLRQRAVNMVPANMVPGVMKGNTASDITSSVPHSSSEPTQARDVSSKYPKDGMSFNESKEMASKAAHDMSHSFEKSPKSSFNTSDKPSYSSSDKPNFGTPVNPSFNTTDKPSFSSFDNASHAPGVSQSAVQGFPEPSKDSFPSHGPSDDFGAVTSNKSQAPSSLTSNISNVPSFTATGSNMSSNQAPAGKRPSIDDGDYAIQNKRDQGSDYQRFVPREAPNRGNLGTGIDTSMGKMPLGDVIDQKNEAGDKAPPLSAGGINAMR